MASVGDVNQAGQILLLPFLGQGHLFPFIELLKHLSSLNLTATLLIPSSTSSTITSSLRRSNHLFHIVEIPSSVSPLNTHPGPRPFSGPYEWLGPGIKSFLAGLLDRPICAVVDVMMSWANDLFKKFEIPTVALFTYGACSAAMEYGSWKAHVSDLKPGEARVLPGLPQEMVVSYLDLRRQAHHHPPLHTGPPPPGLGLVFPAGGPSGQKFSHPGDRGFHGPPGPGQLPRWLDDMEGVIAIMMNTCNELEGPFLDYMVNQMNKPVWGVGPLLPEEYWKSTDSPVHDYDIRPNKQSNYTQEEVSEWLDSKPRGSVLYISFGSEVGPTLDEYAELESTLGESNRPFIRVIRPESERPIPPPPQAKEKPDSAPSEGFYPDALESKVGERGIIIRDWAPQLLILSHPSTGGFLSHCGWNSTVEAIEQGVPILAWPIRGDQHHNAKLVVNYLKVGYMIKEDECSSSSFEIVKKDDIVRGIEKLMKDEEIKQRSIFEGGFPVSSKAALDAFRAFVLANRKMG